MYKTFFLIFAAILLSACASNTVSKKPKDGHAKLKDGHIVTTELQKQMQRWQGTPYRLGGNTLKGVDCSGFVQKTFTERFAIDLPRTTLAQRSYGLVINKTELKPGDLVFFKTGRGSNGLHVGIYQGNNEFVHASTSKGVMTSSMNEAYWSKRFLQARRLQNAKESTILAKS